VRIEGNNHYQWFLQGWLIKISIFLF
jgi:hypothetical protein